MELMCEIKGMHQISGRHVPGKRHCQYTVERVNGQVQRRERQHVLRSVGLIACPLLADW